MGLGRRQALHMEMMVGLHIGRRALALTIGWTILLGGGAAYETSSAVRGDVLFLSNADGDYDIYVARAHSSSATNLTNNEVEDLQAVWSSDGCRMARGAPTASITHATSKTSQSTTSV